MGIESSDAAMVDVLRSQGPAEILELARALGVTKTAIRQRLKRLMAAGLIDRCLAPSSKPGRPRHRYALTEKGQRQTGSNYADLTLALWEEIRAVADRSVRQGLFDRLAQRMARHLATEIHGDALAERMESLAQVMKERGVPFSAGQRGALPVLTAWCCPYPGLAEQDRTICAVERLMFSKLLQSPVRLAECRLDGGNCCQFESN